MLIKDGTIIGANVVIKNTNGKKVNKIKSFDTKTKEAEIYVTVSGENKVLMRYNPFDLGIINKEKDNFAVTAKVFLAGCKAYNIKTGEEII